MCKCLYTYMHIYTYIYMHSYHLSLHRPLKRLEFGGLRESRDLLFLSSLEATCSTLDFSPWNPPSLT